MVQILPPLPTAKTIFALVENIRSSSFFGTNIEEIGRASLITFTWIEWMIIYGSTVFTGKTILNTKEKHPCMFFPPLVFFVSLVVKLFPGNPGRA